MDLSQNIDAAAKWQCWSHWGLASVLKSHAVHVTCVFSANYFFVEPSKQVCALHLS